MKIITYIFLLSALFSVEHTTAQDKWDSLYRIFTSKAEGISWDLNDSGLCWNRASSPQPEVIFSAMCTNQPIIIYLDVRRQVKVKGRDIWDDYDLGSFLRPLGATAEKDSLQGHHTIRITSQVKEVPRHLKDKVPSTTITHQLYYKGAVYSFHVTISSELYQQILAGESDIRPEQIFNGIRFKHAPAPAKKKKKNPLKKMENILPEEVITTSGK